LFLAKYGKDNAEVQMRTKEEIAIFLCFLIISMPFLAADAMANTGYFTDVQVSGEEGIAGSLARTDSMNINATVSAFTPQGDRLNITANDVKFTFGSETKTFSSCVDAGQGFSCAYKGPRRDFAGGKYTVTAKLYDSSNIRLAQKDATFSVDGSPPKILSFSITRSGASALDIYYDVQDIACATCGSQCIGLDKAEIQVGGATKKTLTVTGCSSQSTVTATYSELGIKDGSQEICLIVADRYGQSSKSCKNFDIDNVLPVISSLQVLDSSGKEVSYSSLRPIPISALLNITEDKGLSAVYGDFSALNTVQGESYTNITASCSGSIDYVCRWNGLEILNPKESAVITVSARDRSGNVKTYTRTLQLPLDSQGPRVQSITAQKGDYLRKKDNLIKVEVAEAGSGMGKAEAYLNLYSMNPAYSVSRADNCTLQSGIWLCSWAHLNVEGKTNGAKIKLSLSSLRDDAGNSFDISAAENVKEFTYDDKSPVFRNISVLPLGTGLDVLAMSDVADVTATIMENESGLDPSSVLADFSVFGQNWTAAESCEQDNQTGLYICRWQYSGSYKKGAIKMRIKASDRAGNEKDSKDDKVYGMS
jgi:hypothetical protein